LKKFFSRFKKCFKNPFQKGFKININIARNLTTRLAVYLVLMAIIPLIIVGAITSYHTQSSISEEVEDKISIIVGNLNDNIELFIDQNKNVVSFLATTKTLRSMNQDEITPFLYDMVQQNPQVLRMYVADIEGNVFAVPFATFDEGFDVKNETWYQSALKSNENSISDVRIDSMSGNSIISISHSILSDTGQTIGVISADISLVSLTRIVMNMKVGEEGFAYITDGKGNVIAHKEYKVVKANENYGDRHFVQEALKGNKGFERYKDENSSEQFVSYGQQPATKWGIFVQQPVSEAFMHLNDIKKAIGTTVIIVAVLALGLSLFIGRIIANPIKNLLSVTESVAQNDLTKVVKIKDNTEIGALASSFNVMTSHLKKLVQEVIGASQNLSASAEELASGAEQTTLSTQQVASAIEQIASGANEQVKRLEEISQVINELVASNDKVEDSTQATVSSAEHMTENAKDSQEKISLSTHKMESIRATVERTNTIMEELNSKLMEIGNITRIISEIVDQTNLLALNASIEAARAGEHGRGFAVVADEVRKLAEQSGEAARNISDIVKLIQSSSKNAVTAMGESLGEVNEGRDLILAVNDSIDHLIDEINMVANSSKSISGEVADQYTHIEQIVEMIHNISSISQETAAGTQEVSASSEEQTATMESITASSQDLAKLAEDLNSLVNRFKV